MSTIRPPAVAGKFYSGASAQLADDVRALLAALSSPVTTAWPKALIVPHAGYVFSGAIAASAYARLLPGRDVIRRVVLLGPAHRVALRGIALPGTQAFATPLGRVPVDAAAVELVRALPQVVENAAAHAPEHALEVQLPFLQSVLREFAVLPLAVGRASAEEVAAVLERVWGGPETLILVSSDLSHLHPYEEAQQLDRRTADALLALEGEVEREQACGAGPINGLLCCARRHGLRPELLDLRNSGDTAGDKARVVGYGAFAFWERTLGQALLANARGAIGAQLGRAHDGFPEHAGLARPGATFVTLHLRGKLRGCIGSLQAHRALGIDVRANALAAAFQDPRFPALTEPEFDAVSIEVSLLSAPERLAVADEAELLSRLVPGVDGVILECGGKRATFLPQVWAMLPEPRLFLERLRLKAGIPAGFWSAEMKVYRYGVTRWTESELVP